MGSVFRGQADLKTKHNLQGRRQLLTLWTNQKGKCAPCGEPITKETGWNRHHIEPRCKDGKDILANLALLHPNCHRQLHSLGKTGLRALATGSFAEV
jgi:RNA-directed DNA polymerase